MDRDCCRLDERIDLLDEVLSSPQYQAGAFDEALDRLVEEVICHFREEEEWMREINFPDAADHAARHSMLLEALADFRRGFRANPSRAGAYAIRSFIDDWLAAHAETDDRDIEHFAASLAE